MLLLFLECLRLSCHPCKLLPLSHLLPSFDNYFPYNFDFIKYFDSVFVLALLGVMLGARKFIKQKVILGPGNLAED